MEDSNSRLLWDEGAERGLLAACLLENGRLIEVLCAQGLRVESFYSGVHRVFWERMLEVYSARGALDLVLLVDRLQDVGDLERVGGIPGVNGMSSAVETAVNAQAWLQVVLDKWRLRQVLGSAEKLRAVVNERPLEVGQVLADELRVLGDLGAVNRSVSQGDLVASARELFERKLEGDEERGNVIRTGLVDFDFRLGKLRTEDEHHLAVLMAPPSRGKSSLARQIVRVNCEDGKRCMMFLRETSARNAFLQMAANWAEFNLRFAQHPPVEPERGDFDVEYDYSVAWRAWRAKLDAWERGREDTRKYLRLIEDEWVGKRLWVFDEDKSIGDLEGRARLIARECGDLNLIVVDYLQLLRSDRKDVWSREQEVADISSRLKDLAKELDCTVLALAQMNRAGRRGEEKVHYPRDEEGKRIPGKQGEKYLEEPLPQMSDLRESGAIEQDADVIMAVYMPAIDYRGSLQKPSWSRQMIELHKLKDRNGQVGKARFFFDKPVTTFVDIDNVTPEGIYRKKGDY